MAAAQEDQIAEVFDVFGGQLTFKTPKDQGGAQIVRAHDVAATRQAVTVAEGILQPRRAVPRRGAEAGS